MKGTVTAKSGSTVKLRQKPDTSCPVWWNIPVGTELQVVDRRDSWSKCISGGLTGWMKNEFIRLDGEQEDEPAPSDDPEPRQMLILLTDMYQVLQDLCDRILSLIGRG